MTDGAGRVPVGSFMTPSVKLAFDRLSFQNGHNSRHGPNVEPIKAPAMPIRAAVRSGSAAVAGRYGSPHCGCAP